MSIRTPTVVRGGLRFRAETPKPTSTTQAQTPLSAKAIDEPPVDHVAKRIRAHLPDEPQVYGTNRRKDELPKPTGVELFL